MFSLEAVILGLCECQIYLNKTFSPFIQMKKLVLAIDGPAGTGKSDTAKLVAQRLDYIHYNSGMVYRGITFILLEEAGPKQIESLETESFCEAIRGADVKSTGKDVYYNGEAITDHLRTPRIDKYVSITSKVRQIREKCKGILREFIRSKSAGFVVEGRDIGTQVLPEADIKIYLTASAASRAQRRLKQQGGNYKDVLEGIIQRDNEDITREVGPLKCAEDAVVIDNSEISLEETVELVFKAVKEKLRASEDSCVA